MSKLFSGHYQQATITTISIVALIALSVMVWFVYAYFFPHSWSGQLLIKVNIWNNQYFLLCTEDHIAIFSNMTLPLFSILVPSIKMAMAKRGASIYCSIHTHVNWIKLVVLMILENQTIWISKLLMTKNKSLYIMKYFQKFIQYKDTWNFERDKQNVIWIRTIETALNINQKTYKQSACVKNHIVSFGWGLKKVITRNLKCLTSF